MKNLFVIATLILTAGHLFAFAGEAIGLLPAHPLSLSTLLGSYVVCGVLAIAGNDYFKPRHRGRRRSSLRPVVPAAAKPARTHAPHSEVWTCGTISS
jgi:hypothetical protein